MPHQPPPPPAAVGVLDRLRHVVAGPATTAVALANAGVAVLPCVADGKRPLTRHGLRDASTDVDQVGEWWSRWPQANVAVLTGRDGVDVVDIDRRDDGSGFAVMHAVRAAGLVEGWMGVVATPSGGRHVYFPADPVRPQACWALPRVHVDFRGTGGYVLVPPSRIAGVGGYQLLTTRRSGGPVDASSLRAFLQPPRPPRPAASTGLSQGRRSELVDRLGGWVASRSEGNRNNALFWAACRLVEADVPVEAAMDALVVAAGRAGLPPPEALATIRSAYRTTLPTPPAPARPPRGAINR